MQDLKRASPPGPSANAPAASLAPEVTAHEGQLQYGVQLMLQHHSQHQAQQQQQQPQQRAQEQPCLPQLHATLPVSWEDSQQTTSQANAQSSASALRHGQLPSSLQGFMNGAPPSAAFLGALPSMEALNGAAPNGAAPSPTLRAGGCTGVTVSRQAQPGEQEPRQGQGCEQVKVQDYAPCPLEGPHVAAQRAPQQAQHAHQAQHAQQPAVEAGTFDQHDMDQALDMDLMEEEWAALAAQGQHAAPNNRQTLAEPPTADSAPLHHSLAQKGSGAADSGAPAKQSDPLHASSAAGAGQQQMQGWRAAAMQQQQPVSALPPASQIDSSVLDALPLQVRRELELAYGVATYSCSSAYPMFTQCCAQH